MKIPKIHRIGTNACEYEFKKIIKLPNWFNEIGYL